MVSVKSVDTQKLIGELSQKLKSMKEISAPEWAKLVKTGSHVERPPQNPDWWYVRTAAVLRKIYLLGPIGTNKLRNWFGGKKQRGVKPEKHARAGGKIIRTCLQQLEAAGFIKQVKGKGRIVTPKGQSFLEKTATEAVKGGKK
ncbi:MAG: 30S ribosomal protein S19e [Candidatus Diapherotrites archaeon]|nr:30S ribosomal protein S19e [Candidatus Diapherotrites archaeon]